MGYTYRDILKDPPDLAELKKLGKQAGIGLDKLVNVKSQDYKNIKPELNKMNEVEIAALIKDHPRIMVRPILTDGNRMVTGFNEDDYSALT